MANEVLFLVDKVDWQKALKVPEDAWRIASVRLMQEIVDEAKKRSSVSGYGKGFLKENKKGRSEQGIRYTPSEPGEYPKKKTGWFSGGLSVGATSQDLQVGLYSRANYGIPLEEGFISSSGREVLPRPWMTLTIFSSSCSSSYSVCVGMG